MQSTKIGPTTVSLSLGDITKSNVDAIVNAANNSLMGGGGVDGAIHSAAGPSLLAECCKVVARQGRLPTGKAVATGAGNLRARFVIHTVGPVWRGGTHGEPELLASCHESCLAVADELRIESVAFPAISSGAFGYPVDHAADVALRAVSTYLGDHPGTSLRSIEFVLYGEKPYKAYSEAMDSIQYLAKVD